MKRSTLLLLLLGIPALVAGLAVVTAMPVSEVNSPGPAEVQYEPGLRLAEDQPVWELVKRDSRGPVVLHPQEPEVLFHPTNEGLWKSTDSGESWDLITEENCCGRWPGGMTIHPEYPDTMLIAGSGAGVLLSTDAGESWVRANGGIGRMHHGYNVVDVAYHQKQGAYYAANRGAGYEAIYRSKDEQPWEMKKRGNPYEMQVNQETGNIYVAAASLFLKSTDGGENWHAIEAEEGADHGLESSIRALARVPGSSTLYAGTLDGIYKSYNDGENWFLINDSLTNKHRITDIVVSEVDTSLVLAGARDIVDNDEVISQGGVLISSDSGNSWNKNQMVSSDTVKGQRAVNLVIEEHSNTLFVSAAIVHDYGNSEHSLYRKNLNEFTQSNGNREIFPREIRLHQNYPNPFNATTTIEYELPEETEVKLHIYDLTGRRIATLVDGHRGAGLHQVSWDASEMASGTYIYWLEAGEHVESRQMTLIK